MRSKSSSHRRVSRCTGRYPEGRAIIREPVIEVIFVDSGGGHRAAAQAIETVVREQCKPWELRIQGMQELLNSIDFIRKYTGIPYQEVYTIMLRHGWTRGTRQLIPIMHLLSVCRTRGRSACLSSTGASVRQIWWFLLSPTITVPCGGHSRGPVPAGLSSPS